MKTLSIVIPAYNEARTIGELIKRVQTADIGDFAKEIIVVDDGSNDGTADILRGLPHDVIMSTHEKNRGKGAAVRTGYARATGEYIVVQDADLELDPSDLKNLLAMAQEKNARAVYGSRRLPLPGEERKPGSWYFSAGGVLLTWLANLLYGIHITDEPTCYKMIKRDVLDEITITANGFEFCPELTAKLARRGIPIYEVPIHYTPRTTREGKKIRLSDGLIAIWTLIKYRF